jgi:spore germination cell wall hydrolase CwlJ-like protein
LKIFASEIALALSLLGSDGSAGPPTQTRIEETICMARNIYHEARGEPKLGQIAVGYVVLNRVEESEGGTAPTPCEIITSGAFVWTEKALNAYPHEWEAYQKAMYIAVGTLEGTLPNPIGGATYFYAGSSKPGWARPLDQVAHIGRHRFLADERNTNG